ncbi:hypothetical protein BD311DRAFT_128227 [Dichomitus squalens]|uniref:Uncharacterized protein n=1 Tax=Dichomitus squalens TaxID=114155 RepID=A0A4Q9M719_9APHY|nr:hypothetical protein BD311DRAFT_128227 [Dichomitus squalens]
MSAVHSTMCTGILFNVGKRPQHLTTEWSATGIVTAFRSGVGKCPATRFRTIDWSILTPTNVIRRRRSVGQYARRSASNQCTQTRSFTTRQPNLMTSNGGADRYAPLPRINVQPAYDMQLSMNGLGAMSPGEPNFQFLAHFLGDTGITRPGRWTSVPNEFTVHRQSRPPVIAYKHRRLHVAYLD